MAIKMQEYQVTDGNNTMRYSQSCVTVRTIPFTTHLHRYGVRDTITQLLQRIGESEIRVLLLSYTAHLLLRTVEMSGAVCDEYQETLVSVLHSLDENPKYVVSEYLTNDGHTLDVLCRTSCGCTDDDTVVAFSELVHNAVNDMDVLLDNLDVTGENMFHPSLPSHMLLQKFKQVRDLS